jgi:hypothetical protein
MVSPTILSLLLAHLLLALLTLAYRRLAARVESIQARTAALDLIAIEHDAHHVELGLAVAGAKRREQNAVEMAARLEQLAKQTQAEIAAVEAIGKSNFGSLANAEQRLEAHGVALRAILRGAHVYLDAEGRNTALHRTFAADAADRLAERDTAIAIEES